MQTRRARRNRGQGLVEFALLLPLLMVMTLGVIDMARIFAAWISLTNGVREAALFAGGLPGPIQWCQSNPGVDWQPYIQCPPNSMTGQPDSTIADRLWRETSGLDRASVVLATPICVDSSSGTGVCDIKKTTTITISATYSMKLMTASLPIFSAALPNPIVLSSTTTAQVLR